MIPPVKELGQNFLIAKDVVTKMIAGLELTDGDQVVEIGPGLGALTKELSKRNITIRAVEIDERLVKNLKHLFAGKANIEIIEANILDWLPDYTPKGGFKIIGSLPYYITSPILHAIIKMKQRPLVCVLLIQKEVAQKICGGEGDASYLSSFVQTFFTTQSLGVVDRTKFNPVPNVDSEVIKLSAKAGDFISENKLRTYEGFLHRGFSNPRKMLNKIFTEEELGKVNVKGNLRAQNLPAAKWVEMFKTLLD